MLDFCIQSLSIWGQDTELTRSLGPAAAIMLKMLVLVIVSPFDYYNPPDKKWLCVCVCMCVCVRVVGWGGCGGGWWWWLVGWLVGWGRGLILGQNIESVSHLIQGGRRSCDLRRGIVGISHYSDVIMSEMVSQITASRLFTQPFVQAQIKENIKAPRHWPLWREFTGDRLSPRTKDQQRGKCFHLMTSSWELNDSYKSVN